MTTLRNIAIVLVFACIAQLVQVADCRREGKGRKRTHSSAKKSNPIQPVAPKEKEQKTPTVKGAFKGKFSTKDNTHCTWLATGEDTFTLGVRCKKGGDVFVCEYTAIPTACPNYASNVKQYWKQINRALKKQKALCNDHKALVKVGMCRHAPKVAHFKLSHTRPRKHPDSSTSAPASSGGKPCTEYQKQRAEEYCSTSWSSLCTLFFSMVQGGDDC